jgi:hypothetical protein
MSAYADLDLKSSKTAPGALADGAMAGMESLREKGRELAGPSSRRAAEMARTAGDHVRRKPVTTGLIAAAAGVGLVFLLSSRARAGAMSAGQSIRGLINKAR